MNSGTMADQAGHVWTRDNANELRRGGAVRWAGLQQRYNRSIIRFGIDLPGAMMDGDATFWRRGFQAFDGEGKQIPNIRPNTNRSDSGLTTVTYFLTDKQKPAKVVLTVPSDLKTYAGTVTFNDIELPEAISFVLNNGEGFAPRRWFLENTGSSLSTQKLNGILKKLFEELGYQWQEDIVPMLSSGPNRYANGSDFARFRDEFVWIQNCLTTVGKVGFGISVD